MHHDPLLKNKGRTFTSFGHVFVVLAVHVRLPWLARTGWALPVLFRLFRGPRRGGTKDSPTDRRRAFARRRQGKVKRRRVRKTDRRVVDGELVECDPIEERGTAGDDLLPTKLELAAKIIIKVAKRFPNVTFRLVADHLYNGRNVLKTVHDKVDNVTIVVRGRSDAALYELPPPRKPGQKGRPRVKGGRLPNPMVGR
jgi:hypothetical protein